MTTIIERSTLQQVDGSLHLDAKWHLFLQALTPPWNDRVTERKRSDRSRIRSCHVVLLKYDLRTFLRKITSVPIRSDNLPQVSRRSAPSVPLQAPLATARARGRCSPHHLSLRLRSEPNRHLAHRLAHR